VSDKEKIDNFRQQGWISDKAYKKLNEIRERLEEAEKESNTKLSKIKKDLKFIFP